MIDNLPCLVKIPHNEAMLHDAILSEDNPTKLNKLMIQNQLNRSQNVKVYLSSVESITKLEIPRDPFLFFRSLQLVREDLEDLNSDKKRGSSNIVNLLQQKYHEKDVIKREIRDIIGGLEKKLNSMLDRKTAYLKKSVESEKDRINKLLDNLDF